MKMDFPKKTVSRENDENLGGSELSDDNKNEEMGQRRPGTLNLNLNNPPDERHSKLGFQSGANFPEEQTENEEKDYAVHCVEAYFKGMETLSDEESEEGSGSSSKRKRYSTEEKGEAKIENESSPTEIIFDIEDDLALLNLTTLSLVATNEESDSNLQKEGTQMNEFQRAREWRERRLREAKRRHYEVARYCARRLAHPQEDDSFNKGNKKGVLKEAEDESQDFGGGPFYEAMVMIKKRNLVQELKWMPAKNKVEVRQCGVPSLMDLSLKILARNAEAIVSLELVPDFLRHKLSQIVRKKGKMNAHFLELLASGSPTEIRLNDCSEINTDDFTRIFGACDKKNLIVLQLDLCGRILTENVIINTIVTQNFSLPALTTISLTGAYQLTDFGLSKLARSASALQSVNLSQCSLLTNEGINLLVKHLKSTLRVLYIDHCQNIYAVSMLPALRKLNCLEVLSVAGIETVDDYFVTEIVRAHCLNMRQLVLANCGQLTDRALKFVGKKCSRLCALDLSHLDNLTDATVQYLADGCRSICSLKLCRNNFSDEALAAFLEVSGDSLTELSLNHVRGVGLNTALSLAKCSRNLLSLDLSWCRFIKDEALGFIVDNCSLLRLLKLFGCSQITNVFLNGHSNSMVQIIGLPLTPALKHLQLLEPQHTP
ncbi:hypothetical protein WN944_002506 [Citrus x changshan-huyou]|uniref:F-box/LRR protein n=3 Tax=Citrus TaxID=2706 RepID=A0ACB8P564_CITSI|nr:uncharacterized protein LOC18055918 [Citrus x clementina]KAH9805063.1 F-box/LRR protein [Citrus sinensis]